MCWKDRNVVGGECGCGHPPIRNDELTNQLAPPRHNVVHEAEKKDYATYVVAIRGKDQALLAGCFKSLNVNHRNSRHPLTNSEYVKLYPFSIFTNFKKGM